MGIARRVARVLLAGWICALGAVVLPSVASADPSAGTLEPVGQPSPIPLGSGGQPAANLQIQAPPGVLFSSGTQFVLTLTDSAGHNCTDDDAVTFAGAPFVNESNPAARNPAIPVELSNPQCTPAQASNAIRFVTDMPTASIFVSGVHYTVGLGVAVGAIQLDLEVTCIGKCAPQHDALRADCGVTPCSNATVVGPDLELSSIDAAVGADDDHVQFAVGIANQGNEPSPQTSFELSGPALPAGASGTVVGLDAGQSTVAMVDVVVAAAFRGSTTTVNVVIDPGGENHAGSMNVTLPPATGGVTTAPTTTPTTTVTGAGTGGGATTPPTTAPQIQPASHRRNVVGWIGSGIVFALLAALAAVYGHRLRVRGRPAAESDRKPPHVPAHITVDLGRPRGVFAPWPALASIGVRVDPTRRSITWRKGAGP